MAIWQSWDQMWAKCVFSETAMKMFQSGEFDYPVLNESKSSLMANFPLYFWRDPFVNKKVSVAK